MTPAAGRAPQRIKTMVSQPSSKWNFAEPDFTQFSTWGKVNPKDLQPGDYIASCHNAGVGSVAKVTSNTATGKGKKMGVALLETIYQAPGVKRKTHSRAVQWASFGNHSYYRLFTPQPKPEPVVEAPVVVEEETTAPSLTAIAGVDAGLATQNALLREQNKVLCALLSGMSAAVDNLSEIKEIMNEAWGAKE